MKESHHTSDDIEVQVEVEVEYEVHVCVEIDENGNEIEVDAKDIDNIHTQNGRNIKKIKRKRKRIEKQIETRAQNKMKQFDISLLEQSIIPSIMELTLDNDWRVRLGIIEKFPALA
eukprot:TRINITY_DN62_c0_g1_i2.p1 TRINITY_DN62_c0_g1~~TRINITY_DN62_c0_g1_i2.p1  ORF type:complete len:116 (+),score=41.51 TRINITY_DN62_c0_g1_i2:256-603(+)